METNETQKKYLTFGFYASLLMSILTIVTFGFAIIAIPPSGPNCPGNCMDYPFPDILSYYPRDYLWMYLIVFQLFAYLIFIISNHFVAPVEKKIFSFISVAFAIISTTILLADYFIQFAVVPISVMKGETEGIALITQYNGHGIFIALEELGYFLMSLSFFFLAFVISKSNLLNKAIRIILFLPLILSIASFIIYSVKYGLDRNYRFEVATITVNFLVSITIGILCCIVFKREIKNK